jgi:ribosome-associated protein
MTVLASGRQQYDPLAIGGLPFMNAGQRRSPDARRSAFTLSAADGVQRTLKVTSRLTIPLSEILVRASRSSGPGGQHANVTASRVEASFDVLASPTLTDAQRERVLTRAGPRVVAIAQDERSQARNRELALTRLGERLAAALAVPKRRRATRPTAASRERRLQAKRQGAERKRNRRSPEE